MLINYEKVLYVHFVNSIFQVSVHLIDLIDLAFYSLKKKKNVLIKVPYKWLLIRNSKVLCIKKSGKRFRCLSDLISGLLDQSANWYTR